MIRLDNVSENDYNKIKDYTKDLIMLSYYSTNLKGIYVDDTLVGLYYLSSAFGEYLSIDITIFPEYRGQNIAGMALNRIVEEEGKNNLNISRFMAMVSPQNKESNKVFKKLKWNMDNTYDEDMLEEGGEYFNIYYKDNPYYERTLKR